MENKLKKPTIAEHKAIASDLKEINYNLNDQLRKVAHHYGVNSKEVRMIEKVKNVLGIYRSTMDSNVIKENHDKPFKELTFYYSGK